MLESEALVVTGGGGHNVLSWSLVNVSVGMVIFGAIAKGRDGIKALRALPMVPDGYTSLSQRVPAQILTAAWNDNPAKLSIPPVKVTTKLIETSPITGKANFGTKAIFVLKPSLMATV